MFKLGKWVKGGDGKYGDRRIVQRISEPSKSVFNGPDLKQTLHVKRRTIRAKSFF